MNLIPISYSLFYVLSSLAWFSNFITSTTNTVVFQINRHSHFNQRNMVSLSIIVPVYNKEKYLSSCIESILGQTHPDFELILVNDGSTDGSGLICEKYQQLDGRVQVIHQNNAGVSMARNVGLKRAAGQYIGFIDSDDTIDRDMYKTLLENLVKHGADISVCRMRVFYPDRTSQPQEDFS